MEIILVGAVADNGVIGDSARNTIPWEPIREDMRRFRALTLGQHVLVGRKTYDSFPERFRPLPDRTNIVLTRDPDAFRAKYGEHPLVHPVSSDFQCFQIAGLTKPLYIIGGAEIYVRMLPRATRLEITEVHQRPVGDILFPSYNHRDWREIAREDCQRYSFVTYIRNQKP